jgi:hypothetical protein
VSLTRKYDRSSRHRTRRVRKHLRASMPEPNARNLEMPRLCRSLNGTTAKYSVRALSSRTRIVPELDLVVVVTAGYYQDYSPRAFQVQSGVFRDVLRGISPPV